MKITRAVALVGAALVLAGCASVNTNSDQAAVVYDSGSFGEDTTFKQCQGSNLNDYYDPGSVGYIYPRGQRTYEFDSVKLEQGNAETGDIPIVTKDEVTMSSRGLLNFTLETKCDVLQKFHNQIGLKYGASEDGVEDWTPLLNNYLGVPLQDAMKAAARQFTWRELYGDEAKKDEFVSAVIDGLPADVREFAEGEYFSGFTLKVPLILPPQALLDQIQEQQVQAERLTTINSQAAANLAEAEQIQRMVGILGPDSYILYRNMLNCGDDSGQTPCIPFLPLPAGGSINVTPGG